MPPAALGEFEVLVLMAVLHLGADASGTKVRDEIETRTGRPVARGSVYITLDRLEDKKLLASKLADGAPERGGHPRRSFKVTAAGLKGVRQSVGALARMQKGLEPVLGDL